MMWRYQVTDALIKAGIVKLENGAYYIVETRKLIELMDVGTSWGKLGLDQLHGKILAYSTDPGMSSSGQLFSALLADSLTGVDVSDAKKLNAALPVVKRFFDKQGLMRESSKDLFEEFLSRGMGTKQLVIGYEAQLVEYNIENPQAMASRQNAVRTLYPRPTVWSAHPLIALTGNAKRLIAALKDPQIQSIAWRKHGFRSATGATNDPKIAGVPGIPATIDISCNCRLPPSCKRSRIESKESSVPAREQRLSIYSVPNGRMADARLTARGQTRV